MADFKFFPEPLHIDVVVRTEFTRPPATPVCTPEQQRMGAQSCLGPSVYLISPEDNDQAALIVSSSKNVPPGKYRVEAWLSHSAYVHGAYVQSMRSGSRDLLREALTIPEKGTVPPIEIVLRDDSAKLKVTIRGQAPSRDAHLVVIREGALVPEYPPGLTCHTGEEIMLRPLAPGTYRLFAFDSLDDLAYMKPDALAKYAAKAATVTLSANENLSLIINLIHNEKSDSVSGRPRPGA